MGNIYKVVERRNEMRDQKMEPEKEEERKGVKMKGGKRSGGQVRPLQLRTNILLFPKFSDQRQTKLCLSWRQNTRSTVDSSSDLETTNSVFAQCVPLLECMEQRVRKGNSKFFFPSG
jgi:hypothetical protein